MDKIPELLVEHLVLIGFCVVVIAVAIIASSSQEVRCECDGGQIKELIVTYQNQLTEKQAEIEDLEVRLEKKRVIDNRQAVGLNYCYDQLGPSGDRELDSIIWEE